MSRTDSTSAIASDRGRSGVAGTEHLVLEASDGNRFRAFAARTADPGAPGIMILPDVRGLHPFYEDLAIRFAEAGVHAAAMDYFGRTAGLDPRVGEFDFMAHVKRITADGVGDDSAATLSSCDPNRQEGRSASARSASAWDDGSRSTRRRGTMGSPA